VPEFRLVVPPIQPVAVGPYPVQGTWFPSYLLLEGTGSYPYLLGHNRHPAVLEEEDPDSSPRAFR
jgi:hypothetical protein